MKVSEVIKALQEMEKSYGDLQLTISIDFKKSDLLDDKDVQVINAENLFFGYDQFNDKSDEINIRSFPY